MRLKTVTETKKFCLKCFSEIEKEPLYEENIDFFTLFSFFNEH